MPRWSSRFTTAGIHPRTLAELKASDPVTVRDAGGEYLPRIATSAVTEGGDFLVVWVARAEEWTRALQEGDVPDQVPWPATDVWLRGDEPEEASQ